MARLVNTHLNVSRKQSPGIRKIKSRPAKKRLVNLRHGKRIRNKPVKGLSDAAYSFSYKSPTIPGTNVKLKRGIDVAEETKRLVFNIDGSERYQPSEFEKSLFEFHQQIDGILLGQATSKGYHSKGHNGRQLYDFVHDLASNGHALGEIVYKAIRYNRRKDRTDLVKIAAWAFLIYDKDKRDEENKSKSIKKDRDEV